MAVTLPTFADVGVVDPRSVGTQPSYPANDVVAEGEAALGKGIDKVGGALADYAADQKRTKDKLEQANATTDLFIRLTPLHEQIKHETDPAKLSELRAQFDQLLPTAGTGISDPYARKLWEATHSKAIFQAKADADSRNTVLDRNRADAEVLGRIDQAVRVGAAADDPQAFENAKLTIKNNLDYYQQYGNLSPTHRYELNKKAQTDLVEGRALSLVNKGRVDEASALLEQNRTDLGAARAGNLENKIETRGSANRVDGVVNELIGAAPSGRRAEGNPGSLAMAAAAVDPAIETAVAKRIATTSGLQHWAGIDPATGKPWNPTLRAAFEAAGLPIDGPISEAQWKQADPLILKHESMGGQNVPNYRFDATHTAGGPHQITNSTWKAFGGPELVASKVAATAQPIPTGPQSAPAAGPASPPAQQNRTGLRLPEEVAPEIMSDPRLRNEQERYQALQRYEAQYRSQEATRAQIERIATQRQEQAMLARENEIYADVYSPDPKITPQQVAVDPAFNAKPDRRKAMIELINNPPGSGVPAAQSYNAALSLVERIRLPEGHQNKITTEDQVYPLMRTMNRADFDYVRKTLNDIRGPGGERLAKEQDRLFKAHGPFIDKSNPLMGTIDQEGKGRLYEYERFVGNKIDEYKKAGKNPDDLFDPSNSAYVAKPEILSYYQPTLQQSMQSITEYAKGTPKPLPPLAPWNPPPIPEPFSNAARQPNETPEQYLKRTTGQQ